MTDYTLIVIATIAAILPTIFIKEYLKNDNYIFIGFTLISYLILMITYIKMFKVAEVSNIYPLLQVIQLLVVVSIGIFAFGEKVYTRKVIGVMLGIGSIYVLSGNE